MKICIIGNSHSFCLGLAWSQMNKDYPAVSISFIALAGNPFEKFYVNENNDTLATENPILQKRIAAVFDGSENICFDKFDLCLIAGGFDHTTACIVGALGGDAEKGFSKQLVATAANDLFRETHASSLALQIRDVSNIPIKMIHNPLVAPKDIENFENFAANRDSFDYQGGVDLMNRHVLRPLQMELLKQPDETIVSQCFTKRKFANGERKAKQAEIDAGNTSGIVDDKLHMTQDYGIIRLQEILNNL